MNDPNLLNPLVDTAAPARADGVGRLRTLTWEDFVWMVILSGLATLWITLLMSPSWR